MVVLLHHLFPRPFLRRCILTSVAGLLIVLSMGAAAPEPGREAETRSLSGMILQVQEEGLLVKAGDQFHWLIVTRQTRIVRNFQPAKLRNLAPGDSVMAVAVISDDEPLAKEIAAFSSYRPGP